MGGRREAHGCKGHTQPGPLARNKRSWGGAERGRFLQGPGTWVCFKTRQAGHGTLKLSQNVWFSLCPSNNPRNSPSAQHNTPILSYKRRYLSEWNSAGCRSRKGCCVCRLPCPGLGFQNAPFALGRPSQALRCKAIWWTCRLVVCEDCGPLRCHTEVPNLHFLRTVVAAWEIHGSGSSNPRGCWSQAALLLVCG